MNLDCGGKIWIEKRNLGVVSVWPGFAAIGMYQDAYKTK